MISAIRKARAAGYRAGRANPRIVIPGGTRGIKRIAEPTNPFADVFNPQRRNWFLALMWDDARIDGMRERLSMTSMQKLEFALRIFKVRVYVYG